jgi:predicted metal-dependent HD superfamily phosphohydrolase
MKKQPLSFRLALSKISSIISRKEIIENFKGRNYHNTPHLIKMWKDYQTITKCYSWKQNKDVFLAIIFHDWVTGNPNEIAESKKKVEKVINKNYKHNILCLIDATNHTKIQKEKIELNYQNEKLIHDIDLNILASNPLKYKNYIWKIKTEFKHLTEKEWQIGRSKFLKNILAQPKIFFSEKGNKRWGIKARKNLENELKFLENQILAR